MIRSLIKILHHFTREPDLPMVTMTVRSTAFMIEKIPPTEHDSTAWLKMLTYKSDGTRSTKLFSSPENLVSYLRSILERSE